MVLVTMQSLLQILLSDAVVAAVLALLVSLVAPVCRRPALVRALWILVLLKLLTPPLWTLSLDRLVPRPDPPHHAIQPLPEPDAVLAIQAPSVLPDIPVAAPAAKAPQAVSLTTLVFDRAFIAWVAGSAVMLLICLARVWAFSRILSSAAPADTNVRRHTAAPGPTVGSCPRAGSLARAFRGMPGPLGVRTSRTHYPAAGPLESTGPGTAKQRAGPRAGAPAAGRSLGPIARTDRHGDLLVASGRLDRPAADSRF